MFITLFSLFLTKNIFYSTFKYAIPYGKSKKGYPYYKLKIERNTRSVRSSHESKPDTLEFS